MSNSSMCLRSSALIAAVALSFGASAADREGRYGFGDLGSATFTTESSANGTTTKENASAFSGRLGAGYRVNRYFAVEGDIHGTFKKAGAGINGQVSNRGARVTALGIVPVSENVELIGKASAGVEHTEWSRGNVRAVVPSDHITLTVGVGARYWLNDKTALRLDFDGLGKAKRAGAGGKQELTTGMASVGLQYRF